MSNHVKRSGITEANDSQQGKKKKKLADPVRLHARTIGFSLENGDVRVGACDFQVRELSSDAKTNGDDGPWIKFNSATPKQVMIDHLCTIIAKIKAMELPDPDIILERRTAALIMRAQNEAARISWHMNKLPPAARAHVLRMIETLNDERTQIGATVN
jgi:hypothetical protein